MSHGSLVLEAASESASLDEIVARVAEAVGIARPGEELAGKVRGQLRELYVADLVGVGCVEGGKNLPARVESSE